MAAPQFLLATTIEMLTVFFLRLASIAISWDRLRLSTCQALTENSMGLFS
jgi:hypothetical protein